MGIIQIIQAILMTICVAGILSAIGGGVLLLSQLGSKEEKKQYEKFYFIGAIMMVGGMAGTIITIMMF